MRVFPTASFLSLPAGRLAPGVTPKPGPHDAIFQGNVSEMHSSNAREQTGLETVPGVPRNSKGSSFPAATAMTQEQELTSQTDLPRVNAEQSSLEHPTPILDTDQNAAPTSRKNASEPPQEHTVEQQLASSASGSDTSFHPQEENAPTSPGPQPATASPSPNMAGPLDASQPMTPSERPVLSPTPSLDNADGASETAKAPDTDSRAPGPPKLTSDEVKTLVARGDLMLGSGDVTSARLFYERAANAPDARAALRLGESYDPAFLTSARLNRVAGSVPLAAQWYRRAAELGSPEADTLLRALAITTGVSR